MSELDTRVVRIVCRGEGKRPHSERQVAALRLTPASVEHYSGTLTTAPFNRPGVEQLRRRHHAEAGGGALPDFDLRCKDCGRNPRYTAARMREVVAAILALYPSEDSPRVRLPSG